MNDSEHWHLSKTVSLSHIITTAVAFIGLLSAWNMMDKRIVKNELELKHQAQLAVMREDNTRRFEDEIRGALTGISAKLDRLVEVDRFLDGK